MKCWRRLGNMRKTNKKKVRGAKRKCIKMVNCINKLTELFPEEALEYGNWHLHLPIPEEFIDSTKTPHQVKRLCIQTLIYRVKHLITTKAGLNVNLRVMACIYLPHIWDSQIIIFEEKYFEGFFNRDNEWQKWIPLHINRSIEKELKLNIPLGLGVWGFKEEITDYDDDKRICEVWCIGEVK